MKLLDCYLIFPSVPWIGMTEMWVWILICELQRASFLFLRNACVTLPKKIKWSCECEGERWLVVSLLIKGEFRWDWIKCSADVEAELTRWLVWVQIRLRVHDFAEKVFLPLNEKVGSGFAIWWVTTKRGMQSIKVEGGNTRAFIADLCHFRRLEHSSYKHAEPSRFFILPHLNEAPSTVHHFVSSYDEMLCLFPPLRHKKVEAFQKVKWGFYAGAWMDGLLAAGLISSTSCSCSSCSPFFTYQSHSNQIENNELG
jgi:hypothetical protein